MAKHTWIALLVLSFWGRAVMGQETLPMLDNDQAPRTYEGLWADFDPRAEPLDVEVLHEWERDGVAMQVIRLRVGVFKGKTAMLAAIYGYPKDATERLPGLVQVHGGGQYAHHNAVYTNAKRGYATISIAWAGRIAAPDYHVNPAIVKLFFDDKTDDPNYKLTTDWGAIDAYHAPSRHPGNAVNGLRATDWTLDDVASPRNSTWFFWTMGARRALTFLEQQPQVDPERLGVYGHSMGGKITVLTAGSDDRVKAAAPSCGGMSHLTADRGDDQAMFANTISDAASLKRITCPIIFLSPANDFHGQIDDLQTAVDQIQSEDWRVTCSPHHNHQDTPPYEVATQLWFDQIFKGAYAYAQTPALELTLKTASGVPSVVVRPDAEQPSRFVDVYYTQHGRAEGAPGDRNNTMYRFWRHAKAVQEDGVWKAELPLVTTDRPLWVYANVGYDLAKPVTGAGYYYGTYTADHTVVSSRMQIASADELQAANAKATLKPTRLIESFEGDWRKQWFYYRPNGWGHHTHKLYDPQWAAPSEDSKLAIDIKSAKPNKLFFGLDQYATEVELAGGDWQTVVLSRADFKDASGDPLASWKDIKRIWIEAEGTLRENVDGEQQVTKLGAPWQGEAPVFRNLRWEE